MEPIQKDAEKASETAEKQKKQKGRLKKFFISLNNYYRLADTGSVLRRYVALNSFDGVLTILGILMGSYFSGVEPKIALIAGMSAAVALCVSGIWGAYFTEGAERKKKLLDMEKAVLHKLDNTEVAKAEKFATLLIAAVNGLTPLIVAFIVLIPLMLMNGFAAQTVYFASIIIGFCLLFLIGVMLGKTSKENLFISGLKIFIAGVACAIVLFLIDKLGKI